MKHRIKRLTLGIVIALTMIIGCFAGVVTGTKVTVRAADVARVTLFTIPDSWSSDETAITGEDFVGFEPVSADTVNALEGTDYIPNSGIFFNFL